MSNYFTDSDLDDLMYSDEYSSYIMERASGDRLICNSDTLTQAMEDGYMFEEFIEYFEQVCKEREAE